MRPILLFLICLLLISPMSIGFAQTPEEALTELDKLNVPFSEQNFFTYSQIGNEKIIRLFLDAGMSPNIRNPYGWTPLMSAAGSNQLQMVKLLLDKGANVNLKTPQNDTALHYAAATASKEIIESLLSAGADRSVKNSFGYTAADMANTMSRKDIVSLIKNWTFESVSQYPANAVMLTENQADAKQVLDAIREIRYNVESGVNIIEYRMALSKATVEYRKYVDKYPQDGKDEYPRILLFMPLEPYKDAYEFWSTAIYKNKKTFSEDYCSSLFIKYPVLKSTLKLRYATDKKGNPYRSTGAYWYEDIIEGLWSLSADLEKTSYKSFSK
ncbi:ankyrin repeat domain-containing protein [Anaerospora sp.]|uniref:ankyrin repeat domain-containing protein n=1 Tax=Anaerospora sp. TaxID=1960278 RepID=UPI00289ECEC1|nr:ankyrin repeat domain-containing protein [Anaerospora sp.]